MDAIKDLIIQIEELKLNQQYEKSITLLEEALLKYNSDYRLYEELADIYLYQWKLDKGMKAVNFALSMNPESATGNYLKWFLLLSKDKIVEATKFLEKSNTLMWNNPEVLRNLGWAYTIIGDSYRGISILKRALNINPNDELITEDLAMALIGTGRISEGNTLLQKIWKDIIQ